MLKLHNTLTGKTEEFVPIKEGKVGLYHCGPTVYNYAHIGNLRAYVFADILRRTLEMNGLSVTQVINVTDVGHLTSDADSGEDKMTKALIREGKELTKENMREIANTYFAYFKQDLEKLNTLPPTHFPFASDNITENIELIEKLFTKKIAYTISDGVYFDTAKFPEYGKLGNHIHEKESESRIGINEEKKSQKDFALWKFDDKGWDAPFGKGFPGWHIECSAMSMKYLGETFDIHTGGIDHIPTHHNNEIAQSEAATGKLLAHFWLHSAHVQVDGSKMAKSEDNFITLNTLVEKEYSPLAYRYFLLGARYSSSINFTFDALYGAQQSLSKIKKQIHTFPDGGTILLDYKKTFEDYMNDDLDTPKALALIHEVLKNDLITPADKKATILFFDTVLGLNLNNRDIARELSIDTLPKEIQDLIEKREVARKNKDFTTSDTIRDELVDKGYTTEDRPDGPHIFQI